MIDEVNNPQHYNQNGIEVIDVIETYTPDNPRLANVLKYVCRHSYKGKPLEDLEKAKWYLDREINKRREELGEGKRIEQTFVVTSSDRIAGDTDASRRVKAKYYMFDEDEALCSCNNAACRATIKSADAYLQCAEGKPYCSYVCMQMVNGQ